MKHTKECRKADRDTAFIRKYLTLPLAVTRASRSFQRKLESLDFSRVAQRMGSDLPMRAKTRLRRKLEEVENAEVIK